MLLTRIGFNSKAVITGDITQIDLTRKKKSGLKQAILVLGNVKDVSFNFFVSQDVVRHPVVAKIVQAYEKFEANEALKLTENQHNLRTNDDLIKAIQREVNENNNVTGDESK